MAMRRVNGNLQFLTCTHVYADGVYECNFPGWGADASTWPQATIIREWGMAVYGTPSVKPSEADWTAGLNYDQATGRLYYSYANVYNVTQTNVPSLGLRRAGRSRPGGLRSVDVAECHHPGDARRQPDDSGLVRRYLPGRPETGRGLWRRLFRLGHLFPGADPGGGTPSRWLRDAAGYHPPAPVRPGRI